MNNLALNKTLREEARKLGLCDEWYNDWSSFESKKKLAEKYFRGIDFCIRHDYPKLNFIRENFDKEFLISNGIFLDENVDASNVVKVVLLGKSKGELRYYGTRSCDVYVRHSSDVRIVATEGAKIFVETYNNCHISANADEYSKIFVYRHGGSVDYEGNVVVKERVAVK